MERAIVDSLLKKLGIEAPDGLTPERAQEKLTKRLEKNGPPTGMTTDEADAVRELGIPTGSAPSENEEKPQDEASEAGASPAAGEAPDAPKENAVKKSKTKGGKPKKKEAPAKAPKTKLDKTPAADKKPTAKRESHGMEVFRKAVEGGKVVDKAKLIADMEKAGVKKTTAQSYIVWAKRAIPRSKGAKVMINPFGFRLRETKDEKGVKTLKRI